MSESTSTVRMPGATAGMTMRVSVIQRPAPEQRAASSNAASRLRKSGVSSITLMASELVLICAQTMPQKE